MRPVVDCLSKGAFVVVRREQSRGRAAGFASVRRSALWADCAVLLGLVAASQNSLRSLCSLRSDSCDESDHEARCARSHEPCAARRRTGAAPAARPRLCSDSARCLWKENRAMQASSLHCSGASQARCLRSANSLQRETLPLAKPRAGVRRRACEAASSAGLVARARQRASSTDSSRLFERSEQSERSEFRDAATRPSSAAQSARRADRRTEATPDARPRLCPRPAFAPQDRSTGTNDQLQPLAIYRPFMQHGSSEARSSN